MRVRLAVLTRTVQGRSLRDHGEHNGLDLGVVDLGHGKTLLLQGWGQGVRAVLLLAPCCRILPARVARGPPSHHPHGRLRDGSLLRPVESPSSKPEIRAARSGRGGHGDDGNTGQAGGEEREDGATPWAAPGTSGRRHCPAGRRRGVFGRSGLRRSHPGARRRPGRRLRGVRWARRIRRVRHTGLPVGDGDGVSGRGAHRHGAAVPERPGRRDRHGAHRVRSGADELPRRPGRRDDQRDRRNHRSELQPRPSSARTRATTSPSSSSPGPQASRRSRPTPTRPRSGTRSRRSATPAGPGR